GQPDAGIAAGSLHDDPTGLEGPGAFRAFDDREPDPVLDRATRVGVFRLAVDRRANAAGDAGEPDQWRPADGFEYRVVRAKVVRRHWWPRIFLTESGRVN